MMKRALILGKRTFSAFPKSNVRVTQPFRTRCASASQTSHLDQPGIVIPPLPESSVKTDIFEALPGFEQCSSHACDHVITILRENGFVDSRIVDVVVGAPRIVELSDSLNEILSFWRTLFRTEEAFFKVISTYPLLLYLKPSAVEKRKSELFTVFPNKDIFRLLEECPQVYIDDWETIMAKVYYIVNTMCISQGEIAKSNILSYPLIHIKTRHQFLLRCNKYITPKPKDLKTRNPSLHKIVKLPTDNFVKLAGLSKEEYKVFEKLMEMEDETVDDDDDGID